ncbi:MAG: hypothetical protein ABI857_13535 [Acidobacteriota bacterium]
MSKKAEEKTPSEEYKRFEDLTRKLVSVPKKEIQEREKKVKKESKEK